MLPNFILRQIYYTMMQPYLTYGIILWGSTYQSYLKRTVILQKKAIRYMHKAHYNAHTKPLFYASNVLNINNTYRLEVAKFMYDFTKRKLPTPILDFFASNFTIIHNSTADKSILHRGPKIWDLCLKIYQMFTIHVCTFAIRNEYAIGLFVVYSKAIFFCILFLFCCCLFFPSFIFYFLSLLSYTSYS